MRIQRVDSYILFDQNEWILVLGGCSMDDRNFV